MEGSCSFESLVGTPCSFDRRDKHRSTEIVPLSLCNKDVTRHRSTWSFSGIESETDLIPAGVGIFSVASRDLSSFNICPFHRSELGIGWRRNSYSNSCQVPKEIANHIERRGKPVKADRGVGKNISAYIHQQTGTLIPVGSVLMASILVLLFYVRGTRSSRDKLNKFLASRDISPVRSQLKMPWDMASDRTQRFHIRKAKQVVDAAFGEIAPQDTEKLWISLVQSKVAAQQTSDEAIDFKLADALAECYKNAGHWGSRRQILSIMVDKMDFETLQNWLPGLTRYSANDRLIYTKFIQMCADKGTRYQTFRGCFLFRSGLKQPTKEGRAPSKRLVHASMRSSVPDQCRAYALSDPGDQDYQ
ncbi:hypothetical protein pdam_00025613, partial [Pocillopora damicornis]